MKILITAATTIELNAVLVILGNNPKINTLITGIGMTATAFHLGKHLSNNQYDLAVNVGIAGAFNRSLALGEVVEVVKDQFSELGAEDGDSFLSLNEMGLGSENEFPFKKGQLFAKHDLQHALKKMHGITVNKVHGNKNSIDQIIQRLNPDIESMEGAAFFYACQMNNLNCIQIRSISNYVEKRNKDAWEIELALHNLAKEVKQLIN
ncbi:MAG: futalosine hydrolase [Bacteroidetes bacterium]|nr:MAG: futalosine hydrolase [Bacteroidota bacterium]MBL1144917.1 futalosine hydrolase [Bacteroidota bacterium]MCB0803417.1 futalosine hydrolase [Flavobacteriales bacterium]NOG57711.1 futalosine hydrolase [Bacteroidota bacterium]